METPKGAKRSGRPPSARTRSASRGRSQLDLSTPKSSTTGRRSSVKKNRKSLSSVKKGSQSRNEEPRTPARPSSRKKSTKSSARKSSNKSSRSSKARPATAPPVGFRRLPSSGEGGGEARALFKERDESEVVYVVSCVDDDKLVKQLPKSLGGGVEIERIGSGGEREAQLGRAQIVVGEPGLITRLLPELTDVRWVHSTTSGIGCLVEVALRLRAERVKALQALIERLQASCDEQKRALDDLKAKIAARTASLQPKMDEARKAVASITKQNLADLKSMDKPPDFVRMTVECCGLLLEDTDMDWRTARKMTAQTDFISCILNFDPFKMPQHVREQLRSSYFSNEEFTYERVKYASNACSALYMWIISMLEYAEALAKLSPELLNHGSVPDLERQYADALRELTDAMNRLKRLMDGPPFYLSRSSSERSAQLAAEYCLAQLLANERRLTSLSKHHDEGSWTHAVKAATASPTPRLLKDLTVGVLGMGQAGGACARLLQAVGCRVIGLRKTQGTSSSVELSSSHDIIRRADYLINVLPNTPHTRGLLNKDTLADHPRHACLISIGEPAVLSSADDVIVGDVIPLIQDAFVVEPVPVGSDLWQHRLMITPHVAGCICEADVARAFSALWPLWTQSKFSGGDARLIDWTRGY